MNKTKVLLSVSVLSLLSLTAFADDTSCAACHPKNFDKSHAYVEANVGYGILGTPSKNSNGSTTDPESGNAVYGINVGYNQLLSQESPFTLGGELGYSHNGFTDVKFLSPNGTDCKKISSQDVRLLVTSHYSATPALDLFAKAGIADVMQKMTGEGTSTIGSKTEIQPLTALGIGYALNPNMNMHLQYSHIFGNNPDQLPPLGNSFSHVDSVDSFTIGTSYQIPGG